MALQNPRIHLSVVLVARGPREGLSRTLASVGALASEIVLALTDPPFTWNSSGAFAGRVCVVESPWSDDLAHAKNLALARATGDWILELEPGETLSASDAASLERFLACEAQPGHAYSLLVRVPRSRGSLSAEQIRQVRLWPRNAELAFTGRVRPRIAAALARQGIVCQPLPWHIEQSPDAHEPATRARRARGDLHLATREINEQGKSPRTLLCLAQALQTLGDNQAAAQHFRDALLLAPAGSTERLEAWYGLIGLGDGDARPAAEQAATCVQALEEFPLDAQLLCALGGVMQSSGRLDLAARAYQAAWRFGQIDEAAWHMEDLGDLAAVCCSLSQQLQGLESAALATAREAHAGRPASPRLARHLVDLLIRQGNAADACAQLDRQSPSRNPAQRAALRSAVAGACLVRTRDWQAARGHLAAAFTQGCRDPLCLRWLAIVLSELGDAEAALPVLLAWRAAEPDNPEVERHWRALGRSEIMAAERPAAANSPTRQVRIDPAGGGMPNLGTISPALADAASNR